MAKGNKTPTQMLEADSGLTIICHGIKVRFNATGGLDVYGAIAVTRRLPLNEGPVAIGKNNPESGDVMENGLIFAGFSPNTKKPMYALREDAPLTMKWNDAMEYAANFERHGRTKGAFRIPTDKELKVLRHNAAKIGGFVNARDPNDRAAWYWTSKKFNDYSAYEQYFGEVPPLGIGCSRPALLDDTGSSWVYIDVAECSVRLVCD